MKKVVDGESQNRLCDGNCALNHMTVRLAVA